MSIKKKKMGVKEHVLKHSFYRQMLKHINLNIGELRPVRLKSIEKEEGILYCSFGGFDHRLRAIACAYSFQTYTVDKRGDLGFWICEFDQVTGCLNQILSGKWYKY